MKIKVKSIVNDLDKNILLSSCIIALKRELANILYLTIIRELIVNLIVQNNFNINMNINILRRSALSSINSSRVLSVYSNVFSVSYYKRIEI